ncbi:type II toxin-antitoxin system RelE/ParE family toxin [Pseudoduganella sp. GCM10020061]|uniref:type II toxin-antitoxin system RelE/ParE family toxin n=1 Tax=Pseudoduganella sp. GCM10020061 TaxID=3317345 RepID=UPI00363D88DE
MNYTVRYTAAARKDLARLLACVADRDLSSALKARAAITEAVRLLELFPYSCRSAGNVDPFLRELLVPFGHAGFVKLYRIEDDNVIRILAARHQREEDYY